MIGIIKTLMLKELVGYGSTDKAVYPITSTGAVFDSNSTSLDSIIADLYAKIKNGGSGTGGNTGGDGGGGDSGDSGNDGKDGKTYDYVPCFIYCHADSVPTSKPIGGSYDFTTKTLNPPDGWSSSYANMDKPIYMSIGIACSKDGSKIEWSYPFVAFSDGSKGGDLPYVPVPESNYKTLFIYQHNTSQPDIPTGGSYSFDAQTLNPPDGWYTSKENLTYPVYMSVGFTSKDKNTIEWSYPVIIADKDGLGPGKNPGSALLKRTYVAVIYKQSDEQPDTPSASAGIVHFDTTPYTFDPPIGWSTDTALAVNDDTWCSIKAFYQTADNSYDNSATEWSTPVKANLTKLTLTEAEMDMIAGRISVTSNDVETAFDTWINNTRNLETIAEKVTETTDFYSLTAGQLVTNSDFQLNVAKKLITVSNYKDDVVQNASGEIVAEIKADSDGMLTEIAKNVVIEAKADKDNKDGLIMLVAKNCAGDVAAQLSIGTDSTTGKSYIKEIADNIDLTASDSFSTTVTNAVSGEISKMTQTGGYINQTVTDLTNNHLSSMTLTPEQLSLIAPNVKLSTTNLETIAKNVKLDTTDLGIVAKNVTIDASKINLSSNPGATDLYDKITLAIGNNEVTNSNQQKILDVIADKVDITGRLNTTDLTINGDKSYFGKEGDGYVANKNIQWDEDGNLNLKGNIEANCLKYNIEELRPTVNNATITLNPIRDKCSMYLIIYNDSTSSALNTAKFMLPDNLKPGTSFKIVATVDSNLLGQNFGALLTFYVGTPSNNYILGDKFMKNSNGTLYNQSYAATKVLLNYYCLYEFVYLGYNLWSLTGECDTFNDNNNLS